MNGPLPLCTVRVRGRTVSLWLGDPPDGGPPVPLAERCERLRERLRRLLPAGNDPEGIEATRTVLRATEEYLARHGDPFAPHEGPAPEHGPEDMQSPGG